MAYGGWKGLLIFKRTFLGFLKHQISKTTKAGLGRKQLTYGSPNFDFRVYTTYHFIQTFTAFTEG